MKQQIGEFLATLRKANGYTQQEIAEKLGISNKTLSNWECDKALPDILLLPALAELYGVTVDEILKGERGKNEEVQISTKAEKMLLQSKFAWFSKQMSILIIFAVIGVLLLFVGTVEEVRVKFIGLQWGLFVFLGGLISCITCVGLIFTFWKYAENTADSTFDGYENFCLLLQKKVAISLCVISAAFYVCASFLIGMPNAYFSGNIPEIPTQAIIFTLVAWFAVALAFILTAFLIWIFALRKLAKEDAKQHLKESKKYFKKVALFCLIPVVVSVVLLLPIWTTTRSMTVYENSDEDSFVMYAESYRGNHYFPLSEIEKNAKVGERYELDIDYWCVYVRHGVFEIFHQGPQEDSYVSFKVYRQRLRNGLTFYNLRFMNNEMLATAGQNYGFYGNYIVKSGYAFEACNGGGKCVYKYLYDYSAVPNMIGTIVLLVDAAVCVFLCIIKYNQCAIRKL